MSDERYPDLGMDETAGTGAIDRRDFLRLFGGGIVIFFTAGDVLLAQEPSRLQAGAGAPADFNAYLRVGGDGRITLFTGKIEQGQGAMTVLPLMLAEELEVPQASVDIILGDTDLCPYDGGTFGSLSVRSFGPPLRAAAAEAREVLCELAAEKLGLPRERLQARDGAIVDRENPKTKATYAELAKGQAIARRAKQKPALKPPAEFKVMGRSVPRRDARDKATGAAKYAGDIRLPGMLYARVLRPPAHGSTLKAIDVSDAEKVPGARVVRDGDLIAVLHELPDAAADALAKIKAEYDKPPVEVDDATIYDHLVKVAPQGKAVAQGGDLSAGEKLAAFTIEERYLNAYVAHATLETHTAVVKLDGDKATVWSSTQSPFGTRTSVAQALKLPPENVHVIMPYVGAGFGGKTASPQAVQAARLARITGKPVQVAWSREDEFFNDTFRPAAVVNIKSGVSDAGRITSWDYEVIYAGERSSQQFYDIPHHRTVVRGEWGGGRGGAASGHPFGVGAWRAPGSNTNTFSREVHIDALAAKAGMDPVEFRMKNLANERMKRILKAGADKFGWTAGKSPSKRGFGVSLADYLGTYVSMFAEVEVDRSTGAVRVKRVVCAQDMGVAVNPAGAILQIEGSIMMGLGCTLTEEIHFKGREILDLNFDRYEIPRFSWMPKIETVLLDSPEAPIAGGGEPPIPNVSPAIANAVYDATGARLNRLPMTRERVKAAL
jgi:nicotinate dehydrogenase subunit B